MTKRVRSIVDPCDLCGHYHNYEEGEACPVCGHTQLDAVGKDAVLLTFPTEIFPSFLYLGSSENASSAELLKSQRISRVLNLDPNLPDRCSGDFTLLSISDPTIDFDKTGEFLEKSRWARERVFVHCTSGNDRSAAAVVAYLMRQWRWSLLQSFVMVKDIRPAVEISSEIQEQLKMYESKLFRSTASEVRAQVSPEVHIRIDSLCEQEVINANPSWTPGDEMDLSASSDYVIEAVEHNKSTSENPFIEIPVETLDQSMENL